MTAFTEIEQETLDIDWFAIDTNGRIGHFAHGGFQSLPPSIAKSKESLEMLKNYFDELPVISENSFAVCSDFQDRKNSLLVTNIERYIKSFSEMSKKGLYAYDSPPNGNERPYFRVTLPKKELKLSDLPENIKEILENLRMNEISFVENSIILENFVAKF